MHDIRIERWAHALVHYSLNAQAGETISIKATPLAEPLVAAVYRELLHMGATPLVLIELESLEEILLREGNDSQLTTPPPLLSMAAWRPNMLTRSLQLHRRAIPKP